MIIVYLSPKSLFLSGQVIQAVSPAFRLSPPEGVILFTNSAALFSSSSSSAFASAVVSCSVVRLA